MIISSDLGTRIRSLKRLKKTWIDLLILYNLNIMFNFLNLQNTIVSHFFKSFQAVELFLIISLNKIQGVLYEIDFLLKICR